MNNFVKNRLIQLMFSFPYIMIIRLVMFLISINHPYVNTVSKRKAILIKQHILGKAINVSLSGTGCLMIFHTETVVKIPLSLHTSKSLLSEYENYLNIKRSSLSALVAYRLVSVEDECQYFKMTRLKNVPNCGTEIERDIFEKLKSYKGSVGSMCSLETQRVGLDVLVKNIDLKYTQDLLELRDLLLLIEVSKTAMHGDFTPLNIMENQGDIVLIDLDRFDLNGFCFIDEVHYYVEKNAKLLRVNSYHCIINMMDTLIELHNPEKMVAYIFFRIGAENRPGVVLHNEYYNNALRILLILKKLLNEKN